MKVKLTKRAVEAFERPSSGDVVHWDEELHGFGVRVWSSGKRAYFVKYRNKDGRQRKPTIGVHGVWTAEQARSQARQWLAEAARGEDPAAAKRDAKDAPTVAVLAERYLVEHARLHKKPSSLANDERLLQKRILPALAGRKLREVTRDDIARLHESLRKRHKEGERDGRYEANRVLALLSKMFNLAEEWGLRPEGTNPCRHVKKYKEEKRNRFLGTAELGRLGAVLADAEQTQAHSASVINALRLLVFTGCRLSEVLTLRWSEVDFERSMLHLSDSKTGAKPIHLNAAAFGVLRSIERVEGNPYVLPGRKHATHLVNLEKPWRQIRERADLSDTRLHDLRHTFASAGAATGLSLPMLGELLGHSQPSTTKRYTHFAADPVRQANELVGAYLATAMTGRPATATPRPEQPDAPPK